MSSISMAQVCGFVLCVFLGLLGGTIIVWIWREKIDLSALLSEANGEASMSRFQLLIFTFVISISLFELVERTTPAGFPDIPNGILTLLGISASTYAVGKGISYSQPDIMMGVDYSKDKADAQAAANQAKGSAAEAKGHADNAQQAVQQTATNVAEAKDHADNAQQAVQQTATNAAEAQQAADRAIGNPQA